MRESMGMRGRACGAGLMGIQGSATSMGMRGGGRNVTQCVRVAGPGPGGVGWAGGRDGGRCTDAMRGSVCVREAGPGFGRRARGRDGDRCTSAGVMVERRARVQHAT